MALECSLRALGKKVKKDGAFWKGYLQGYLQGFADVISILIQSMIKGKQSKRRLK